MKNKSEASPTENPHFSQWLARVLPFEHVWIRYVCCLWLTLSSAAAAWAYFVVQPATDTLLARSSYLLEVDENLTRAQNTAETYDLPALREQAYIANKALYQDATTLDHNIVKIVEALKLSGWKAVVASVERDNQSSDHLVFASYNLELMKGPSSESLAPATDDSQPINTDVLAFLRAIAAFERRIDIDHFEIITENGKTAKVFATLSAAITK